MHSKQTVAFRTRSGMRSLNKEKRFFNVPLKQLEKMISNMVPDD
jgi:hypothetical protein